MRTYVTDGQRTGTRGPAPRPVLDRLLDRIEVGDPNECWPISGPWNNGYPRITVGSRADGTRTTLTAHAVLYDLVVGDAEPDDVKDHLCRNHACGNPDHVEPVPNAENVLRGEGPTAVNARRDECSHKHAFTLESTIWDVRADGRILRRCRTCRTRGKWIEYVAGDVL
jgi:hypothetical protein